jgi:phage shock protein A
MAFTIGGIPVFKATIEEAGDGMVRVSLVDRPAVERDFVKYAEDREPLRFAVADEEKRLLYGVLMRANMPIYRRDPQLGEYFIVYTPEVIRTMAEKYLAESRQNIVNAMHQGEDLPDIYMVQYFIKDTARGIAPAEFPDVEDGSLLGEFHVTNDEVWARCKSGELRGFSLEGYFGMEPSEGILSTEKVADDVRAYLDGIDKSKQDNMAKMERIKTALARLVARVQMGSISTDKGVLFWDGDGELEVGFNVYQENENGERAAAADGNYAIEGDLLIVVADGKVADIIDAEAPVEEPSAEAPAAPADGDGGDDSPKAKDEVAAEEVIVEEGDTVEEVVEEVVEETNDQDDRIAALEARIAELEGRLAELAGKLAEYGRQPKGQPAHEAVKKAYSGDRADSFSKALKYARK